jgi:acyl-CoA thioester hydrolase
MHATVEPASPTAAPFSHGLRVYWEDTDAGGVVFYANYLKFFERARTEWLRARGVSQHSLKNRPAPSSSSPTRRSATERPARLDDWLEVTVQVAEAGRASFTLEQEAWCRGQLLARGRIRVGCVDADTLRPRRIPEPVIHCMT